MTQEITGSSVDRNSDIMLELEDGTILDVVSLGYDTIGNDAYAYFMKKDENGAPDPNSEIIIYRYLEEGGKLFLETIDYIKELRKAAGLFEERIEETIVYQGNALA